MTQVMWRRIAEDLAGRIRSGDLEIGDQVPSHNDTAAAYGVDRNTARKAADVLRHLGVLRPVSGRGLFVAALPPDVIDLPEPADPMAEVERRLTAVELRLDRLEQADGHRPGV